MEGSSSPMDAEHVTKRQKTTHPFQEGMRLLGRENSLFESFFFLFQRFQLRQQRHMRIQKNDNPIIVIPASPGLGKTRLLFALTCDPIQRDDEVLSELCKNGFDNSLAMLDDGSLKWALLTAIKQEKLQGISDFWKDELGPKVRNFCDTMLANTKGLVITFNGEMPVGEEESSRNVNEMIGTRVHFAHTKPSVSFRVFSMNPNNVVTLDDALDRIMTDDEQHLILGVDEVLVGAGLTSYSDTSEKLNSFLTSIGEQLDRRPNLHVICTSLSYVLFEKQQTQRQRPLQIVTLPNLKFDHVEKLAKRYCEEQEADWFDDTNAMQTLRDCDGVPRLIEEVFRCLRRDKTLEALRRDVFWKVRTISMMSPDDPLLGSSLVLSLRGMEVRNEEHKCFDQAVFQGFLRNSNTGRAKYDEPVFPLLVIACILDKAHLKNGKIAKLWSLIEEVLRYDPKPLTFNGVDFEMLFRVLWKLRSTARVFQVYQYENRNVIREQKEGNIHARPTSLKSFLTSYDVVLDVAELTPAENSSTFDVEFLLTGDILEGKIKPGLLTKQQIEDADHSFLFIPESATEIGYDDVRTFPIKTGYKWRVNNQTRTAGPSENLVLLTQYIYTEPGKTTTFGNGDVVKSLVNSVQKNREVLQSAIIEGRFAFLFVAFRAPCGNVSAAQVRNLIKGTYASDDLLCRAADHIGIMTRDHVANFIPRPFRSRPQFRFETQIFSVLEMIHHKKTQTKR